MKRRAIALSIMLAMPLLTAGMCATDDLAKTAAQLALETGEPLPAARSTFEFVSEGANRKTSDLRLHNSLSQFVTVKVELPAESDTMPEPLNYWLSKVETSGGRVDTCFSPEASPLLEDIALWALGEITDQVKAAVKDWALYRSAGTKNAVVVLSPSTSKIIGVAFTDREKFEEFKVVNYGKCATSQL